LTTFEVKGGKTTSVVGVTARETLTTFSEEKFALNPF